MLDSEKLPFNDSSFDTCVSFQVFEHIDPAKINHWLSEVKRVTKPNGSLILSTPNRNIRLLPHQKPWNPHHKKEYDHKEFKTTLSKNFEEVNIKGIYGLKDIQIIEANRVKQTPFNAYIKRPIMNLFNQHLHLPFTLAIKKTNSKKQKNILANQELSRYSINDFRVDASHLSECLDLIAVCRKTNCYSPL